MIYTGAPLGANVRYFQSLTRMAGEPGVDDLPRGFRSVFRWRHTLAEDVAIAVARRLEEIF